MPINSSRTPFRHKKCHADIDTHADTHDHNVDTPVPILCFLKNEIAKNGTLSKNKQKELSRESLHHEIILNSFSEFYSQQYGKERWKSLFEAMCKPAKHVAMINNFASCESIEKFLNSTNQASFSTSNQDKDPKEAMHLEKIKFVDIPCYSSSERFPPPFRDENGIMIYYLLDAASVMVIKALNLKSTDSVLDLCAAPGGKSLAILQYLSLNSKLRMHGDSASDGGDEGALAFGIGHLTSNELSPSRRHRLRQVITNYVPPSYRHKVKIVSEFESFSISAYDKILVDAPCSSERHLLRNPAEFSKWKVSRTKNNAKKQYKILLDAVKGLHIGGILVYVTCSISKLENDGVVKKTLENSWVPLEEVGHNFNFHWEIGERTEKGWIVLPDKCDGWGPLYFAVLKRAGDGEFRKKIFTKSDRKAKYERKRNLHEGMEEEFDDDDENETENDRTYTSRD